MSRHNNPKQFRNSLANFRKLRWFYLSLVFLAAISLNGAALGNPFKFKASTHKESETNTSSSSTCASIPALSLRCLSFQDHLYAVADVNLQSQEIIITTSEDAKTQTYTEVASNLSSAGIKPLLITNAGIYSKDNRPLGLLISPKGKLHNVNTAVGNGSGNFSWDSAVFQISSDGAASIVSAHSWQNDPRIMAATQSGPQLASFGKINPSLPTQSRWSFTRTAIGVDQSDRHLVHLVVSRDAVTLFELATFLVNELHCSEALHLDGDLSAFYIPSAPEKFLFSDPGERIVTVLSIIEKRAK